MPEQARKRRGISVRIRECLRPLISAGLKQFEIQLSPDDTLVVKASNTQTPEPKAVENVDAEFEAHWKSQNRSTGRT
jgi:hypothetical protein